MPVYTVHFWKKVPFIRLLVPLVTGIIIQWHFDITRNVWWLILATSAIIIFSFFLIPFSNRFRFYAVNGLAICAIFISLGALLTWNKDIRHNNQWLGSTYLENDTIIATLDEAPVEKPNSVKANASVNFLWGKQGRINVKGRIIIYFKKGSASKNLGYGSRVLFTKPMQEIRNAGNPGGFDFKRYALFKGITHQVYLDSNDFVLCKKKKGIWLENFLCHAREKVLTILRGNIKGPKELGLAEALLIGYKDDLDPELVQSYTHTGVVHIIAISGMHLGLIYWLLLRLFKPLQKQKRLRWLRLVLILAGLWLFSLLTGAQASILRSAVMFTCIVIAESISRKTSMYNTLAFSAFIMLCYDPFLVWDVGFQLSYAAVLSIVIFMRPIYNWFYFENKFIDAVWKLNSISIAAQILTVPLSLYHFHQFPNYFLLTNFVAVPLSSLIVLGEIFLCALFFIPFLASLFGKLMAWMIWLMDSYIERIEALPGSLWESLQVSILQTICLFIIIAGLSSWLMNKSRRGLRIAMLSMLVFLLFRGLSFIRAGNQEKLIVYNIPQHFAIDFIDKNKFSFLGDSAVEQNSFTRNFYLQPSRTLSRVGFSVSIHDLLSFENYSVFGGCHILLINKPIFFEQSPNRPVVDLLIISKNPKVSIPKLTASLDIKQIVFDGSISAGRIKRWKKGCDSLGIPCHVANEKGSFVMNL